MKQELPIAVTLLAAGCLLWFVQSTPTDFTPREAENSDSTVKIGEFTIPDDLSDVESDSIRTDVAPVQQASFQSDVEPIPVSTSTATPFIHPVADQQAIEFLKTVSNQIANSKPLQSTISLTGNLFGQSISGRGNYYQMGQGTHKSRIQLTFGDLAGAPSVSQLCDGRFIYNTQTNGKVRSFEFVDMKRIQQVSLKSTNQFSPAGWVASGGIASLFRHLATAFRFGKPTTLDNADVVLRGSWDPNAIRQILESIDGESDANATIDWSQVPVQLPHAVEIVFSQDSEFNYFPKTISFFRFVDLQNPTTVKRSVSLAFAKPQHLHNTTDRFFVVDASHLESVDVTDRYIARIERANRSGAASTVR